MRITLFLLFNLFFFTFANAQLGVQMAYVRPTGDAGFSVKPTIASEILFKVFKSESAIIPRFGLGFMQLTPRLDTFPSAGRIVSYNSIKSVTSYTVVPGKLAPSKVTVFYLNAGIDFQLKVRQVNLYPGLCLNLGTSRSEHYEEHAGIGSGHFTDNYIFVGGSARLGCEYLYKRVAFFTEIKRNINKMIHGSWLNYNEYMLGVRFKLKE